MPLQPVLVRASWRASREAGCSCCHEEGMGSVRCGTNGKEARGPVRSGEREAETKLASCGTQPEPVSKGGGEEGDATQTAAVAVHWQSRLTGVTRCSTAIKSEKRRTGRNCRLVLAHG